jgi:DHA1 family tetracycline resistance protein-like MFS transporter
MNRRLVVILFVVALDAVGIGLIFPILPSLLRELTGRGDVSMMYGVIIALYALMQFVFSPVLGVLSDRYGRRPVLLVSTAGAALDYLVMSLTPGISVLLLGRAIAGITSANLAVATAYITDITEEGERTERFGQMNACFGVGFIIGPLLGGVVGHQWLRAPFALAAGLCAVSFVLVYLVLPESRVAKGTGEPLRLSPRSLVGPARWALSVRPLVPLVGMFVLIGLIGNIPGTVWVLYTEDRFGWSEVVVGASLATFGLFHAGAQGLLTGPLARRFGELRTIVIAVVADATAFVILGTATHGWVPFALAPLFALGGVSVPALQALATKSVGEDKQGELQGVLASATSLTSVIGPLVGTGTYSLTRGAWIGAVWIVGAAMYTLAAPLLLAWRSRVRDRSAPAPTGP